MTLPLSETHPLYQELVVATEAADAAAATIMTFYTEHSAKEYTKDDKSPVTDADLAADALIRERLTAAFPGDALLTEEGAKDEARLKHARVWIVDPVDGTAQYIAANGNFDVLIALAEHQKAILAVTVQPTTGLMHAAVEGEGAWRRENGGWNAYRIAPSQQPPRIVTSVYYIAEGSEDAVKAVAAATGSADPVEMKTGIQARAFDVTQRFYDVFIGFPQKPGTSPGQEWDLAANDLIINEAGGRYTDCFGRRHMYNKRNTHFSGGLLSCADPVMHERILAELRPYLAENAPSPDPADDIPAESEAQ